ncbi:hypothetical protein K525DRAFT_211580, partial [Schizophyllum commune Loenen D]
AALLAAARPIAVGSSRSPRLLSGISNTATSGLASADEPPNYHHKVPGCASFMAELCGPRFSWDCWLGRFLCFGDSCTVRVVRGSPLPLRAGLLDQQSG